MCKLAQCKTRDCKIKDIVDKCQQVKEGKKCSGIILVVGETEHFCYRCKIRHSGLQAVSQEYAGSNSTSRAEYMRNSECLKLTCSARIVPGFVAFQVAAQSGIGHIDR